MSPSSVSSDNFEQMKANIVMLIDQATNGRTRSTIDNIVKGWNSIITNLHLSKGDQGQPLEIYGRQLSENIINTLQSIGDAVYQTAVSGFDIGEYMQDIECNIAEINKDMDQDEDPVVNQLIKPDFTYYHGKAEMEYEQEIMEAKLRYEQSMKSNPVDESDSPTRHTRAQALVAAATRYEREMAKYNIDQIDQQVERRARLLYTHAMDDYQRQVHGIQEKKTTNRMKMKQVENLINVLSYVQGMRNVYHILSDKLRSTIQSKSELIIILGRPVKLNSGMYITNPYEKNHLAAMLTLLTEKFLSPSLITLSSKLQAAFRYKMDINTTIHSPEKAVIHVEDIIHTFQTLNLWEFMTKDMLVSTLLITTMHANAHITSDIIKASKTYLEEEAQVYDESTKEAVKRGEITPLFDKLKTMIETEQASINQKEKGNNANYINRSHNNKHQRVSSDGMELAAAAKVSSAQAYEGLVTHDKKITDTIYNKKENKQFTVSYTATKKPCNICNDISLKDKHHKPKCYAKTCVKCNLFGHKAEYCKQIISSSSEKGISSNQNSNKSMMKQNAYQVLDMSDDDQEESL